MHGHHEDSTNVNLLLTEPSQVIEHYSRTCLKREQAAGMERLSFLERVHPSLKSGCLFQRGER